MKKRIISAIVMIILFVPILILGDYYYVFFCSILGLMSLWEIMRLEKRIPNAIKILGYLWCIFIILYKYKAMDFQDAVNYPMVISMLLFFSIGVIVYGDLRKYDYKDSLWMMMVILLIGILYNSLIRIRFMGLEYVIYCLLISITTDTFAYVGGRLFGRKKLSPSISPNKTVSGSVAGSIVGTIFASVYYHNIIGNKEIEIIILLSFVLTILCQCGDLFFSSIKRYYNVKDYSNLIPGHGGILDRFDSTLFVVIGFLLYSIFI